MKFPYRQSASNASLLCLIIGIQDTFLVNLSRIVAVILVALYWSRLPSLIFHDYGGTLLILLWLALFWYLSQLLIGF